MVSALPLADGPAMYFGSTIMTFALPYGAFIAASIALFYLFRARHSGPRLRWSVGNAAQVTSVITREPGPAPAPGVTTAMSALPVPTEQLAPAAAETGADDAAADDSPADASPSDDSPADDKTEGKDGEPG